MWGVSNQIGNMSLFVPFVQFQMVIQKVPFPHNLQLLIKKKAYH
jgi:hypothetical protein